MRFVGAIFLSLTLASAALPSVAGAAPEAAQKTGSETTGEPTEPTPQPAEPASAEPSKPANKPPQEAKPVSLDHRFQLGLAIRVGTGYKVVMPYHEEFCGQEDKSVCGHRQPVWLELSPSFGITRSLELLVDIRINLEDDPAAAGKGFFIAPGIKYYVDPESWFKFYATGQLVLESQDQLSRNSGLSAFDIGVRSALGIHFDILRYVGLYAQGGIILAFNRWLTFVVDFAGGVQVRY
jgi:hypothetical protein